MHAHTHTHIHMRRRSLAYLPWSPARAELAIMLGPAAERLLPRMDRREAASALWGLGRLGHTRRELKDQINAKALGERDRNITGGCSIGCSARLSPPLTALCLF
jgi:hypothetical protein